MRKPREPWTPPEEQRRLFPDVSGNAVNGLGEKNFRRPSVVFWAEDPSTIPHGPLIKYMIAHEGRLAPAVTRVYRDTANRAPPEYRPVAPEKVSDTPANWTRKVKDFALANEGALVGVTALKAEWFFENKAVPELPWVVMIGAPMDYAKMERVPPTPDDPASAVEVGEIYNRVDRAAGKLADWIRAQGWYAEHQGGPRSGSMTLIPPALECGFGELGKHGSIINRDYGSLIRIAAVRTDLPLIPDHVDVFGADDFCASCNVCSDACPPAAISDRKQWVRGAKKWYVDFDKCIGYFNETFGCAVCIAVCPWSRPGTASKMAERMTRRRAKKPPQP